MKKAALFIVFMLCNIGVAQTYVLDPSFGTNGTLVSNKTINPTKGKLIGDNYFLLSGNTVTCVSHAGAIVSAFADDGTLAINVNLATDEQLTITDMLEHGNFIYVYGNVVNTVYNTADMVIIRMNNNFVADSSFGVNGVARINLGLADMLSNFVVESDGGLFCVGTMSNPFDGISDFRTVYFKLLPNGTLNYSFDAAGYKSINYGAHNSGGGIVAYGTDCFVVGLTPSLDPVLSGYNDMFIAKIDGNGTIDLNYGINGFNRSAVSGPSNSIKQVLLHNDRLFVEYYFGFSFANQGYRLMIYDMDTSQKIADVVLGRYSQFSIYNDKIYSTSYLWNQLPSYMVDNKFNLARRNLDGTIDTTFHTGGLYNYEFAYAQTPGGNDGASASSCFIADDNGNFAIAGRIYEWNSSRFGMLRITQGNLGTHTAENLETRMAVYPNPFEDHVEVHFKDTVNSILVHDLLGRTIDVPPYSVAQGGILTVDLSHLTLPGTYLLEISGPLSRRVEKIIKR